jgi:hypothetical protein
MSGNRAFDTGSERIWNTINKGVCTIRYTDAVGANKVSSANGRTSSSGTCRRPRMTSNCVRRRRNSEYELEHASGRVSGWILYIGVFYSLRIAKADYLQPIDLVSKYDCTLTEVFDYICMYLEHRDTDV